MKGTLSTNGISHRADKIIDHDGIIVQIFDQFGAIPFVKSATPPA